MVSEKSAIYLEFFSKFIEEIKNTDQLTNNTFESIYINNKSVEKQLWNSGLNKKTIGDTYGSQSVTKLCYSNENRQRALQDTAFGLVFCA